MNSLNKAAVFWQIRQAQLFQISVLKNVAIFSDSSGLYDQLSAFYLQLPWQKCAGRGHSQTELQGGAATIM